MYTTALELTTKAKALEGRGLQGHFEIKSLGNGVSRGFQDVFSTADAMSIHSIPGFRFSDYLTLDESCLTQNRLDNSNFISSVSNPSLLCLLISLFLLLICLEIMYIFQVHIANHVMLGTRPSLSSFQIEGGVTGEICRYRQYP